MPDPNNPYNVDQSLWGQMSGNDMNIFNQTMAAQGGQGARPLGGDMRNQLAQIQAQPQQSYGGGGWGGGGLPAGMSAQDWATFSGIVGQDAANSWRQQNMGSGPGNSGDAGPGGFGGTPGFSGFSGQSQGSPPQGSPPQGRGPTGTPSTDYGVFGNPAAPLSAQAINEQMTVNGYMANLTPGFFGIQAPNPPNNFTPSFDNPYGLQNPPNMEDPFSGYMNSLTMSVNPAMMNAMNMVGYDAGGNGTGGGVSGAGAGLGGGMGGGYGFGIGPGPGGENSVGPDGGASPY